MHDENFKVIVHMRAGLAICNGAISDTGVAAQSRQGDAGRPIGWRIVPRKTPERGWLVAG